MVSIFKRAAIAVAVVGFSSVAVASADVRLQGAGSTFVNPIMQRWVAEYQKDHPDVKIDYQSIGSGGGIKSLTDKTIDFAGSDAPMSKKELQAAGGADNIIEIPDCAGGVVPAYNVPGVSAELKFTGKALADIYQGKVSNWNDPEIAQSNPGVNLPNLPITPAWRTDGSGTTYVWTNYLATQSDDFKDNVGVGKQVKFPTGQGGKGNEGVSSIVQQTQGAIGYVEQNYADKNNIQYGAVQNKDGNFVKATPDAVSKAGEGAVNEMKGNLVVANIWNQPGKDAYPIASFTYVIIYKDLNNVKSKEQAQALVNFFWWATHDGQKLASDLDYAPLSDGVQKKIEDALKAATYKGESISLEVASK